MDNNPTEPSKFLTGGFGTTDRVRPELGQMRTKNPVSSAVSIGSRRFTESPYFTALLVAVRFRPGQQPTVRPHSPTSTFISNDIRLARRYVPVSRAIMFFV